MHGNTLEIRFRQSIDSSRLQSFHLKLGRLLLKEALNAHNYGLFLTKMFSNLLTMLEVELTHKTLVDIEELTAYIAFLKYHLTLCIFLRYENTLQDVQLIMSHCAVTSCQFSSDVALIGTDNLFHKSIFLSSLLY